MFLNAPGRDCVRESRMPQIGDLLFVNWLAREGEQGLAVGIVSRILKDNYGHQKHVFVEWSTSSPPAGLPVVGYREEYGYCGINIHNWRRGFKVIRDGREIV